MIGVSALLKEEQNENISRPANSKRADEYGWQISALKSCNLSERKKAAEVLCTSGDTRTLKPLFEALMDCREEDDLLKSLSLSLFSNLWAFVSPGTRRIVLSFNKNPQMLAKVMHGAMDRQIRIMILGGRELKPNEAEKSCNMVRNALENCDAMLKILSG
jgi:hypothetical protein